MHDEIVCSPQALASGINWRTVAGSGSAPAPTPPPAPPGAPPAMENDMLRLIRNNVKGDPGFGAVYAITGAYERIPVRAEHYERWIRWVKWWTGRDVDQVSDLGDWWFLIWTTKPREGPNSGAGGYPT